MASSDIYEAKENPWAKKPDPAASKKRRRRHHPTKTFDEAVNPDFAHTHRRRSRNSGLRRLQHRLKNPEFSKKFWLISVGSFGLLIALLIVWDLFFRYPNPEKESAPEIYRAIVE